MLFTQLEFLFFIAIVLGFLYTVKNFKLQKIFLLICSYYFYGYWNYKFLILIFLCTLINYFVALGIVKVNSLKIKKSLLLISLLFCLGILGYYKYCNFFIASFSKLFTSLGWNVTNLNIILPVGISFFTFQTLSYTIDVYRGKLKECRNFCDFALFVAFFPQLVAGPIVRASEFLPQLETPRDMTYKRFYSGIQQFMIGLFKKVLIADTLALFVDKCFDAHNVFSGSTMLVALLAYTLQIFCDFSGYSDMAIGLARIMGYDFNVNFNIPYISKNVSEFWHRWHISLSTWLRDYLYIPLGGNRGKKYRVYFNLFITMVLGGLWHGAAWTFVLWGVLHGLALVIHKYFTEKQIKRLPLFISWFLTMITVMLGWLLFRAKDFSQAKEVFIKIITWESGITWFNTNTIIILIGAIFIHLCIAFKIKWGCKIWDFSRDSLYSITSLILLLYLVVIFRPSGFQPFIYFQF